MDILENYKETYQKEIERRAELNTDVSIPTGIISVLATGTFFYLTNFDFKLQDNSGLHIYNMIFFIVLLIIELICLLQAIYFLLKSYTLFRKKQIYDYVAFPNEIDKYFSDYVRYFVGTGDTINDANRKANEKLEEYYIEAYIRTATKNTAINDERATYLHKSKKHIVNSLIILLIAFLPYMINNFAKPEKLYRIENPSLNKIVSDSVIKKQIKN